MSTRSGPCLLRALATLSKCIKAEPKNYECHKLLGTVYAKSNNSEAGAKEYKEFLRLAPPGHPAISQVQAIIDQFEKKH